MKLTEEDLYHYGPFMAKLLPSVWEKVKDRPDGKLILVTAMTPTPAGEGKTVTTIGLAQGLAKIGEKVVVALREPSLGPVFGLKGGAVGGGLAKVEPAEEIDLHFTGDFHALTSAQNLLAALVDNHIHFGFQGGDSRSQGSPTPGVNLLPLDPARIVWPRALDVNDRALRNVTVAVGQKGERSSRFVITAASELMAILCLANDYTDLRDRLTRIIIGYDGNGKLITAGQLKAVGAMMKLLKQAFMPNLVQTTEGVPALIHGGPFANIAHGCNSLLATRYALKLADFVVTEAGFGADLGAEKFFDIKCRVGGLTPSLAVVVATVRALRYLGEGKEKGGIRNCELGIREGLVNLKKHVENVQKFGVPVVVAVNRFAEDTDVEVKTILQACAEWNIRAAVSEGFDKGGEGCKELAELVREKVKSDTKGDATGFRPLYSLEMPIKQKIETVAREIYGADGVDYSEEAERDIKELENVILGSNATPESGIASDALAMTEGKMLDKTSMTESRMGPDLLHLPICIAKTQYSFSDDPKKINVTGGFRISVRSVYPAFGAGFIVVLTGDIMTMPGLPRRPLAEKMEG